MKAEKKIKIFQVRIPVALNQHSPVYIDKRKAASKNACRKKGGRFYHPTEK